MVITTAFTGAFLLYSYYDDNSNDINVISGSGRNDARSSVRCGSLRPIMDRLQGSNDPNILISEFRKSYDCGARGHKIETMITDIFNYYVDNGVFNTRRDIPWLYDKDLSGSKVYLELDGYNDHEGKPIAFEYQGPKHYSPGVRKTPDFIKDCRNDDIKRELIKAQPDTKLIILHYKIFVDPHKGKYGATNEEILTYMRYVASRLSEINALGEGKFIDSFMQVVPEPARMYEPRIKRVSEIGRKQLPGQQTRIVIKERPSWGDIRKAKNDTKIEQTEAKLAASKVYSLE